MDLIIPTSVLIFIFGLCVGSFLNVLIYRLPHSLPITGRSFCPSCKKSIAWYDNIPLLSFVILRGRCRFCHSPISWQYPLIELVTGLLTIVAVYHILIYDILAGVYSLLVIYVLIVVFFSDLKYQIIPDQIVYTAIVVTLIYNFVFRSSFVSGESWLLLRSSQPPSEVFTGYLLTGFGAAGFFLILFLITKSKGMGLGDVKLAGLMGLVLGFPGIVVALYLAFLTGAAFGVILILTGKKKLGSHIPFGPFLAGATILNLFYGEVIWQNLTRVLL